MLRSQNKPAHLLLLVPVLNAPENKQADAANMKQP